LESSRTDKLEEKQVALMHASYFANIAQYDYLAYATQSMIGLLGEYP
jgi:endonuclease IV